MAISIKFGTDGWRAIIADDYTVENIKRVAEATARYMKERRMKRAVIGYDCRFGGQLFAETTARVLGAYGIKCYVGTGFVSTPMVSLGVVKTKSDLGVVITASHNPPSYNGYKLKAAYGGPMVPAEIAAVEALVPEACTLSHLPTANELRSKNLYVEADLEKIYLQHVRKNFDLKSIKAKAGRLAYDAMYGAGQNAVRKLLPRSVFLRCDWNPGMYGQAPEPIHRNLLTLSELVRKNPKITAGLANDGDADRIGMYDEEGKFVDSHHLLLILLLYLHRYKGMSGKVVFTFSVTDKLRKMAEIFGLPYAVTPVGFKYIAEIMMREDVLIGGEESGGLAVKGHIPERDGIWMGLLVLEFMAKTGKTIKGLVQEVYDIVGPFAFERDDLHITEGQKQAIITACRSRQYTTFGPYRVHWVEDLDGWKFHLGEECWVMIRASGTEPVLRVYAQGPDSAVCRDILDATRATIL
ncbi:MAG: phosphoglucomutase/phosphomannomutase family protein [Saprospiraceae bacterium]|nr:phosphoglucomutase/phosphomannomutase family protein [Saprospiraceae bacterium]MDW8484213.1 phosphoglucomutase/phosphomannomutase family protein [Saprospiraceae bacterium]